jgi:hypothetical protein
MDEDAPISWTFDALLKADLEHAYQQGKDEVLRDRAFRILLAHADTVERLTQFAFHGDRKVTAWSTDELLEISNRFRLMSSPENEIRLYRECGNEDFRNAPRVREFYVLALTKAGRPAEAIREGAALIAQGGQNALVWGALAQSHMARAQFAEHLLAQINDGDALAIAGPLAQQMDAYFPELTRAALAQPQAQLLREQALASAARIFKQGFVESGDSYPGLGWMFCTLDQWCDAVAARHTLQQESEDWLDGEDHTRLDILDGRIAHLRQQLASQGRLLEVALALQGGDESQDYWTHAGYLRLAVLQRVRLDDFDAILARAIARGDAAFKLNIVIGELQRVRRQLAFLIDTGDLSADEAQLLAAQAQYADLAIAEMESARVALERNSKPARSFALNTPQTNGYACFIAQTINFHALIGNLVPVFIEGTIGKVGARVPDLLINRRVQQDLIDLIEDAILPGLPIQQRGDPLAIIHRIQDVVGRGLHLAALQDLQSSSHAEFDMRSDGMIALSGVDRDLRKDAATGTELTAALLMQTGDCRETMYLNGALFASWQQLQTKRAIARAVQCMDLDYRDGFEKIVCEDIPALLRHQLRGGQVNIFVEDMAMEARYQYPRNAGDNLPLARNYAATAWRAGQPLTRYELENSILAVTYSDGSQAWVEPKDAQTGAWQPITHVAAAEGGVPIIANAGEHGENIMAVKLLNQVESHAMTFLVDTQAQTVELCDGFYNERLFDSPYAFSAGALDPDTLLTSGLIRAGDRAVQAADGNTQASGVQLQFTRYSQTQYATGLIAGDTANSLQFMGRAYHTDFKREQYRLQQGDSPIPALLAKIHDWQLQHSQRAGSARNMLERQLTRLMLELAKEHPELLQLRDVTREERLICQDAKNELVFLVLSGRLHIMRNDVPIHDAGGNPISVTAGGLVGEISALRGTPATATVQGDAVVMVVSQDEIRRQLAQRPQLLAGLEDLTNYRLAVLAENGFLLG